MDEVITIGVDLAKNVIQVHGVDAEGTMHGRNMTAVAGKVDIADAMSTCQCGWPPARVEAFTPRFEARRLSAATACLWSVVWRL
jgi:hypothetical protein